MGSFHALGTNLLLTYPRTTVLGTTISLVFIYIAYQLVWHPVARFPGPRLAALSNVWRFIHQEEMAVLLPRLHEQYKSPIIRIGPNHLHVGDSRHHHDIYRNQNKILKDPAFYLRMGLAGSIVSETDPRRHQALAALMTPVLNQKAIDQRFDILVSKADMTRRAIYDAVERDEPVGIQKLFARATWDIISIICLGTDPRLTDNFREKALVLDEIEMFMKTIKYVTLIPGLCDLVLVLPEWLIGPVLSGYARFRKRTVNLALDAAKNFLARGSSGDSEQQSIIDRLVEPHLSKDVDLETNLKALPLTEIVGHSYVLLLAGTETTALTLTGIMYHLCKHTEYKRQIRKELRELGDPDGPEYPWEKAVRAPSLDNFAKEGLRMGSPVTAVLPRVTPRDGARIGDDHIPANVVVGGNIGMANHDPAIFSEPNRFAPERWEGEAGKSLNQHMVSYTEGSRRCIGRSLADIQIRLILAKLVLAFDFDLDNPTWDIDDWEDRSTKAFRTPLMLRASKINSHA